MFIEEKILIQQVKQSLEKQKQVISNFFFLSEMPSSICPWKDDKAPF